MFRVPMNGQYGISSRVFDWTPRSGSTRPRTSRFTRRIRRDHRCRRVPPDASARSQRPTGWMALQYVAPNRRQSLVLAYRLGKSTGSETLRLFGLDPQRQYTIQADGHGLGTRSGRELSDGFTVQSDSQWRAVVFELQAVR